MNVHQPGDEKLRDLIKQPVLFEEIIAGTRSRTRRFLLSR